jgi:hypothetical protein
MGASRYMHAERREGDSWKLLPPPARDEADRVWKNNWKATTSNNCFAALCSDYRQYGKFELVAPLRGFPPDVSSELYADNFWLSDVEQRAEYAYSPTWYTLKELLEFDWNKQVLMDNESLCAREYAQLQDAGKLLATNPEMESFIARVGREAVLRGEQMRESPREIVPFRDTYRQQCPNLMDDLDELSKMGDPENIRIIVWWNC